MYRIPTDSTNAQVTKRGKEWVLSYCTEGQERQISLHNSHLPSRLMCTNAWNNAAFVQTEHPPVQFTFPFGKHAGKTAQEVPEKYVEWWIKNVLQDLPEEI
jgi:hypothetical protein